MQLQGLTGLAVFLLIVFWFVLCFSVCATVGFMVEAKHGVSRDALLPFVFCAAYCSFVAGLLVAWRIFQ